MSARYTDEEAQEILRRALERTPDAEAGHRHEVLQEAAAEVGIAPEVFERAAAEYQEDASIARTLDAKRRGRIQAYWRSVGTFALVNVFLFALDMLTSGGTWFYYPLLIWGLFVALRGYGVLLPPSEAAHAKAYDKERKRLRRNLQRQAERQARETRGGSRKRSRKAGGGGLELERSIERGVTAFLDALARQVEPTQPRADRDKTDFERYVERREGAPPQTSPPIVTPPPRVRAPDDAESPRNYETEPAGSTQRSRREKRGKR